MTMRYRRRGRDVTEEEALDADGILRDGFSVSVPMTMRDSVQRAVAQNLHDGHGNRDVVGHRPGFIIDAHDARDAVEEAYRLRDEADQNAWRADAKETWGTPGDQCTVREGGRDEGSPGHLRRIGNRLVCVPDKPTRAASDGLTLDALEARHRNKMANVYAAYDAQISEMWRNP